MNSYPEEWYKMSYVYEIDWDTEVVRDSIFFTKEDNPMGLDSAGAKYMWVDIEDSKLNIVDEYEFFGQIAFRRRSTCEAEEGAVACKARNVWKFPSVAPCELSCSSYKCPDGQVRVCQCLGNGRWS